MDQLLVKALHMIWANIWRLKVALKVNCALQIPKKLSTYGVGSRRRLVKGLDCFAKRSEKDTYLLWSEHPHGHSGLQLVQEGP